MNPTSLPNCSTSRYCAQSGNCAVAFYGSCQPNPRRWARTTSRIASAMVHYAGHPICYAENPPPGCNTWQEYMKRRITIDTSGIEPETRVKARHLPLVVYADAPWRLTRAIRDDVLCTSPGAGQSTAGCDTGRPHITH